MTSTSSTSHDSDDAKLPGNYTESAASHSSLPAMRRDGRSFLNLPAELRCMIYAYFTPEDQLNIYPTPSVYNVLLHICKQIREEAQKEIQKAADKYFRAHDAKWLRKPCFRFIIKPVIDPTEVTVIIPKAFPQMHVLDDLFLNIPLLRLRLRQLNFDISKAKSKASHSKKADLLELLHYWIKLHKPQAFRTTISWGHCQSWATATEMNNCCRKLELKTRPRGYNVLGRVEMLIQWDSVSHSSNEHSMLEAVALSFQRITSVSRELA